MEISQHNKGTFFVILSAIGFATYGIWSRYMVGAFGEFSQAWTRALILLIILVPFGILTKKFKVIAKKDLKWFVVIAVCGGFNQAPYFFGFEYLPIGTATLLFYLMLTLGTYIFGAVFFGEKLTAIKYSSLVFAVVGLSIIYRFSLTSSQIIPAISTMIAGLMGAGGVVFSKKISSTYSETQILLSYFVVMFPGNLFFSLLFHQAIPAISLSSPWLAQLGYTVALVAANALVIAGFKYLEPSIGGVIGLLEVVFGVMFGIILFHENLTLSVIVGGVIIILAVVMSDMLSLIKLDKLN